MLLTYQITPAFADQDTTEERLMFRYRAATEDELNLMRTGGINLKAAIIVQEILPGFPSTQSEFKPNDIVLMVNGQSAITLEALEKLVAQIEPADKIKLSYINFPQEGRTRGARGVPLFKLVKGGVQKTLYYTLAVIKSKLEDKPPVSTKPVDTSSPGTSTPTVSEPTNLPVAKVVGIKTEFDPFKALYSISSDSSLIKIQQCPEGLTTQLVSITQKTTVGFPTTTLFITSTNPEWKFPGKPESLTLTVIIDNKNRFEIKCFDKTSYLFKTGTCYENISFNLDKQQLQSFAAATKIKAQLASSEFEFPNEYPVHVKQFLEEIQKYVKARRRSQ